MHVSKHSMWCFFCVYGFMGWELNRASVNKKKMLMGPAIPSDGWHLYVPRAGHLSPPSHALSKQASTQCCKYRPSRRTDKDRAPCLVFLPGWMGEGTEVLNFFLKYRLAVFRCQNFALENFVSNIWYMNEILNKIHLQNFLHGWMVNREMNLISLLNLWFATVMIY